MKYTKQEVMQFVMEEDVKFIRLAFCDVFGKLKNISIMPGELNRAFEYGIAIDGWSVDGFDFEKYSDLLLHPDPSTLVILPWRPEQGRVVRMFCDITWADGRPFEGDTRYMLKQAISYAEKEGYSFKFGSELEFYFFKQDENGNPTKIPLDNAGYMDVAPDDKGENVRREICIILEQMGIYPESSHHEEGPGQNEVDFRYSDPLTAADNAITFCNVVRTVAERYGLVADFSPKPIKNKAGNGMHINFSVKDTNSKTAIPSAMAGIMDKIGEMTLFLNPTAQSYERFGSNNAPQYITWSAENRSQLVRIPASSGEFKRAELRSPDPVANPYIAYTLMIYAGMYGINNNIELPPVTNLNLYTAPADKLKEYEQLPVTIDEAKKKVKDSDFINNTLPKNIILSYLDI